MDFTNIKDMSIGNLKIKEIYFNNSLIYKASGKRDMTLLKLGEVINSSRVIPIVKSFVEGNVSLYKMGQVQDSSRVIHVANTQLNSELNLLLFEGDD